MPQYYDGFFVPPHKPAEGTAPNQCLAASAIRNPAGNVVQWHCQLSQEQWDYHKNRNGKPISKAVGATRKLNWTEAGSAKSKDIPVHVFAGFAGVYDPELKRTLVPDKVPDIEDSAEPVI
jgi:hypothetical protein